MARKSAIQNLVTGGELSSLFLGRQDFEEFYNKGLFVCQNGLPLVQGPWTRRPGTAFLHQTKFNNKVSRLFPFQYSTSQTYVLEFGDLYIRFFTGHGILTKTSQSITSISKAATGVVTKVAHGHANGARLHLSTVLGMTQLNNREVVVTNRTADTFELYDTDGVAIATTNYGTFTSGNMAEIFEVVTPWTEADIPDVRITQSADVLYIVHPDHPQYTLTRVSALSWALARIVFTDGPYDATNATTTTLTPSNAVDDVTVTWVERANPSNTALRDVIWNGSIFVAVGSGGYIVTSSDGITWTQRTSSTASQINGITWNGSIFVAVQSGASANGVHTSPDGINWTAQAVSIPVSLLGVTWSATLSLFVAVGSADGTDGYIITSPDGITWTERANPKNFTLAHVVWNGSIFVAVGSADGTDAYIITSSDGITWTERANPKNFNLLGVTWSGSLFVAVGVADGVDAYIVTSPDGITWTEQANPKNFDLNGVAWNGSIFAAVGNADGTDGYLITSPDGITWTERANPKNFGLTRVAWNGLYFTAVGVADGTDAYIITNYGITITASNTTGINSNTGFQTTDVGRLIRLRESSTWGYVVITERVSSVQVRATVFSTLTNTNAKVTWRLGIWSNTTGFPACATFHEDRLYFAGPAVFPQRFDGSNVSAYTNFSPSATDGTVSSSNAVAGTLNSDDVNAIKWLVSHDKGLLIGTTRGEWRARGTNQDEAITPTNLTFKAQTRRGSSGAAPVVAGDNLLFIQRGGRKVREMAHVGALDKFKTPDMTSIAEHITAPGISELAYQEQPQPILWAVRDDGVLLGLTYDREAGVVGWHRHPLGGSGIVESVAVVVDPTETRDELYLIVRRTINGGTKRYVEYMSKLWEADVDAQEDAFQVDCGITDLVSGTTITGLWFLEGATVGAYVDGKAHANITISNGIATFNETGTIKTLGYFYNSDGQTMPIEGGSQDGSAQGKIKIIKRLGFWLLDTLGLKYGPDADTLTELLEREWGNEYGVLTPLATGVRRERFEGNYDRLGQVYWRCAGPFPATICALMPQFDVSDDS